MKAASQSPAVHPQSPARSLRHLSPLEQLPVQDHATSPQHPSPLRQTLALPESETFELLTVAEEESVTEAAEEQRTTREDLVKGTQAEDEDMVEAVDNGPPLQRPPSPLRFMRGENLKLFLNTSPDDSEPLVLQEPSRPQEYVIPLPQSGVAKMSFVFDDTDAGPPMPEESHAYRSEIEEYDPGYTLPPLRILPPEFHRRDKSSRQQRKKEKGGSDKGEVKKEEWAPMGMMRLGAIVKANPLWKKVARATKYLSTQDWTVRSLSFDSGVVCLMNHYTGCDD